VTDRGELVQELEATCRELRARIDQLEAERQELRAETLENRALLAKRDAVNAADQRQSERFRFLTGVINEEGLLRGEPADNDVASGVIRALRRANHDRSLLAEAQEQIKRQADVIQEGANCVAEGVEQEHDRLRRLALRVSVDEPDLALLDADQLAAAIGDRVVDLEQRLMRGRDRRVELKRKLDEARERLAAAEDATDPRTALRRRLMLAASNGQAKELRALAQALEALETAEGWRRLPGMVEALGRSR